MNRVIGLVACGFTLAACSASVPSLDFLNSSPTTASLRFESVPAGAEVKVAGKTCRTPCELKLEVADVAATFTRKGYEPQTIAVNTEGGLLSGARFSPNPVHAELVAAGPAAKNRVSEKPAAGRRETRVVQPNAEEVAAASDPPQAPAATNSTGWSPAEVK